MTQSFNGSITLTPTDASTIAGTVAGYLVSFSDANGAAAPTPIAVPLDGASFSVTLDVGVWTPSVVAVDASGNPLSTPATGAAVSVSAPTVVLVNIPTGVALSAVA